jgi:hypothetical protein
MAEDRREGTSATAGLIFGKDNAMKILTGNLSSDADRVDFNAAKAAKDVPITDPFDPRCARAADIPVTRGSSGPLFPDHPTDEDGSSGYGGEQSECAW